MAPFLFYFLSGLFSKYIKAGRLIIYSLVLAGIGMVSLPLFLKNSGSWIPLIPCFITLGIANALVNPLSSGIAVNAVTPKQVGMVSGLLNVGKQFGTSLGLVIMGLTLTSKFNNEIASSNFSNRIIQKIQAAGPASAMNVIKSFSNNDLNKAVKLAFYRGMDNISLLG